MADDRRHLLERREGRLSVENTQTAVIVNATVTDITERAAASALAVAEATHVKPKRVVMRYTVLGVVACAIAAGAVLWMGHEWKLDAPVIIAALAVVGAPFGIAAARLLPRLAQ